MVGRQNADIADNLRLRDVATATILAFYIWGAHWRHLVNTTEPSMCGGDAALCQITLTTCFINFWATVCKTMLSDRCRVLSV